MAKLIWESQITTTTTIAAAAAAAVRATKTLTTRAYSFLEDINMYVCLWTSPKTSPETDI